MQRVRGGRRRKTDKERGRDGDADRDREREREGGGEREREGRRGREGESKLVNVCVYVWFCKHLSGVCSVHMTKYFIVPTLIIASLRWCLA